MQISYIIRNTYQLFIQRCFHLKILPRSKKREGSGDESFDSDVMKPNPRSSSLRFQLLPMNNSIITSMTKLEMKLSEWVYTMIGNQQAVQHSDLVDTLVEKVEKEIHLVAQIHNVQEAKIGQRSLSKLSVHSL